MKNTIVSTMMLVLTACSAEAPAPTTSTAPMRPGASAAAAPPAAPAASASAPATDPALLEAARAYEDNPTTWKLTARLKQRADARARACGPRSDSNVGCNEALPDCAEEYTAFVFDRLEGTTAFYKEESPPGRPYTSVLFQKEDGTWKVDAVVCGAKRAESFWAP